MDFSPVNVILSREHFILSKSNGTLWCDRRDGRLTAGTILQKDTASDYTELGHIWGVIGKLCFFTDGDWKLIVITQASLVGTLPLGRNVYCIDRIGILPLSVNFDLNTDLIGFEVSEMSEVGPSLARPPSPASRDGRPRRNATGGPDKEKLKEVREREKVEKRLTEALLSMFNESQSFYFSMDFDLTRPLQRQLETPDENNQPLPWKQVDERFFWNKWMITELLDETTNAPKHAAEWVLPVVQGYVEVRRIPVRSEDAPDIMQPGWTKHYREEREKIIKECMEDEVQKKRGSRKTSKEMELKNMASVSQDKLAVPLKNMSSSGFGYESDSDNVSDDASSDFSPVTFTDAVVKGTAVPGVRKNPSSELEASKVRADADADLLRHHGTRHVTGEGGSGEVGQNGRGGATVVNGEGGEGDVWCVVEKEENVIRARICSRADILEGNGSHAGVIEKEEERDVGEKREIEGHRELEVDAGSDVGTSEMKAQNRNGSIPEGGSCDENGMQEDSHLTVSRDAVAMADPSTSGGPGSSGLEREPPGAGSGEHSREERLSENPGSEMQDPRDQCLESATSSALGHDSRTATSHPDEGTDVECRPEDNGVGEDKGGPTEDLVSHDKDIMKNTGDLEGTSSHDTEVGGRDDEHHGDKDQKDGRTSSDDNLNTSDKSDDKSCGHAHCDSKDETDDRLLERSSNMFSPTRYYTTTEVPEVEGVMVDLLDVQADSLEEVTRSLLLSAEQPRTHGEPSSEVMVDEFPEDLSRTSPMVNPFLGQQSSPSWSRHERARSKERELQREEEEIPTFTIAVISRRSCHRAGTRYRRRGVDSDGHVANYVETELVVKCGSHVVSYVIVRGSVPVYWSQPGYKYRPLPVMERSDEDTQKAFHKHFEQQLDLFKEMVVVNLVKQNGREKLVGDAFEQHILLLDSPQLTYMTFDFHQHYKTNQVMALQKLRNGSAEFIKKFKFCWIDTAQSCGPLCKQEGVFRVNCMDCLDRTNVVESIFSKEVLQMALHKLGVLPFEESLGGSTLVSYQDMWANNGDIISKQYAGTAAMKGDITRYGERKITGMMKDGYNSAHRYYINIFRDSYRQVLIDLMQGVNPFEAFSSLPRSLQGMDELEDSSSLVILNDIHTTQAWSLEREEAVADIISYCEAELFPNLVASSLHSWILMEPAGMSFVTDNKEDEPCVVIYCQERAQLCIAKCDIDAKKVICFLRIPIFLVQRIIIGQLGALIRNNKRLHMRVHYSLIEGSNVYFTFTTLNQMSPNEERAILLSIAEFLANLQPMISIQEQKINKKRSPTHQGIVYLMPPPGSVVGLSYQSITASATPLMSSITSAHSSIPSPSSVDTDEREGLFPSGQLLSVQDEKEAPFSAPSSPKARRSLHRRQRSQSLDDITIGGLSLQQGPSVAIHTPTAEETSQYNIVGSDESDSELDLDEGVEESRILSNTPKQQQTIELLPPGSNDPKESEEEGEGGGGWRLSQLKGKLLSKMKASKNNFLLRPRSHSPQPVNTSGTVSKDQGEASQTDTLVSATAADTHTNGSMTHDGDPGRSNDTDGDGEEGKVELGRGIGGSQQVGAVKQRLRVNSPSLWRKKRKVSPSGLSAPVPEDMDLVKLEDARKKCKSRMIFI